MSEKTTIKRNFDITAVRRDFPVFARESCGDLSSLVDGKSGVIHLNNAATTHKPECVINAISEFYSTGNANVHRGSHLVSMSATQAYESARQKVQYFINAKNPEEIIWTKGATESLNLVANAWGLHQLTHGDEIILMVSEHHANIVPWQEVAKATGAVIKVVPLTENASINMTDFKQLLSKRTRIVGVAHVSNATGCINPIKDIIKYAHKAGAVVLVDGAQAGSHLEIDVQALGCDFYVLSAHKIYGPNGLGVLYGRQELLETFQPYQTGGGMITSVSFEQGSHFNSLPFLLEAGTPNIASVIGFAKAIDYLQSFDRKAIKAHETMLLQRLYDGLTQLQGIKIIGDRDNRCCVVSFVSDMGHHQDLSLLLSQKCIMLRSGHHCAMPLMKALGIEGTLRVSVAMYTCIEEVEFFLTSLQEVLQELHSNHDYCQNTTEFPIKQSSGPEKLPDHPSVVLLLQQHDWSSRYRELIRLGKKLPPFPDGLKKDDYLVPGCESNVWFVEHYDKDTNNMTFQATSDSAVICGLITVLLILVNNRSPAFIVDSPLSSWFEQLGLVQHLSRTRGNGLRLMIQRLIEKSKKQLALCSYES